MKRHLLALAASALLFTACASSGGPGTSAPLTIQEQGSFAVGGTVKRTAGTFDPIAQGAYTPTPNPQGRCMETMRMCSTRCR